MKYAFTPEKADIGSISAFPKCMRLIVNDIRNFVFGLAGASVYGSCKSRKQKFVMSFTIIITACKLCLQDHIIQPDFHIHKTRAYALLRLLAHPHFAHLEVGF